MTRRTERELYAGIEELVRRLVVGYGAELTCSPEDRDLALAPVDAPDAVGLTVSVVQDCSVAYAFGEDAWFDTYDCDAAGLLADVESHVTAVLNGGIVETNWRRDGRVVATVLQFPGGGKVSNRDRCFGAAGTRRYAPSAPISQQRLTQCRRVAAVFSSRPSSSRRTRRHAL